MTSAAAILLRRRALLVVGLVVSYWGAGSCGLPAYGKIAHPGADAAVATKNTRDVRGVFSWDTLPVSFHGGNLSNQYSDESIQQLSRYPTTQDPDRTHCIPARIPSRSIDTNGFMQLA